jgi:hypothetical protein
MTDTSAPAKAGSAPSPWASSRRVDFGRQVTSERIDEHLTAFRAAGGVIEVLGNTPIHKPWRAATRGTGKPAE